MPNALKNKRFNTWISPEDLDYVNQFCQRNHLHRSTYMRDVSLLCMKYNILPDDLENILKSYLKHN